MTTSREAARNHVTPALTVTQAAHALGVHPQTVYGWLQTGAVKGFRLPTTNPRATRRAWRIPQTEIQKITNPTRH